MLISYYFTKVKMDTTNTKIEIKKNKILIFNHNLRKIRELKNISRIEFAKQIGIGEQMLQYIERGERLELPEYFYKIPEILNCSFAELFGEIIGQDNIKLHKFPYYNNLDYNNFDKFENIKDFEFVYLQEMIIKSLNIKTTDKIIILQYKNNNMEGDLSNNDFIVVKLNDIEIINDALYLVKEDKNLRVKKITKENPLTSTIIISSNIKNKGDYEPYTMDITKALYELIVGEVIFWGRSRHLSLLSNQ